MQDKITIPRTAIEAFVEASTKLLDMTKPVGPEEIERAEVIFTNNKRKQLSEAVYQAEKAMYDEDRLLKNENKTIREVDYSLSKERWIAR